LGQGYVATKYQEAGKSQALQKREAVRVYTSYAPSYDLTNSHDYYFSPRCISLNVKKRVADLDALILDAACGTGLMGSALKSLGYHNVIGVDVTDAMLKHTHGKACYRGVVSSDVNYALPFRPKTFDAIVCSSAFIDGILRANALENLLPYLKSEGHVFCDIEMLAWSEYGFRELIDHLRVTGRISWLDSQAAHFFRPAPDEEFHGFYVSFQAATRDREHDYLI